MLSFYLWGIFNNLGFFPAFNENESGISTEVLIGIVVVAIIFQIVIFYLGYRLIKYGTYNDSVLAIIVGVLLTGFWIGLIIAYFLSKKRDREIAEKNQKEREEK